MSEGSGNGTTVSTHVTEEFDRSLKKAQIGHETSMDVSRAEALRRLMSAAIEDPSLLAEKK